MTESKTLDASTLKAFDGAAAGHDGVLSDSSGELFVKPCTQAEVDFYQQTLLNRPDFAEVMPTFMGTLQLGASAQAAGEAAAQEILNAAQFREREEQKIYGTKVTTDTAIVLENLEVGFRRPNVLDLKLGAKLYGDGTPAEKAARLDKVSSETTSSSLHFRIAGMKVWNGQTYDMYGKQYGRQFHAENVKDGLDTFFSGLTSSLNADTAVEVLETIEAEIAKARHALERAESRMFNASLLIVYEGDSEALKDVFEGVPKTPRIQEKAPTLGELKQSEEEEDDEDEPPVAVQVKMIDFAHAAWTPGQGKDENVIIGMKNFEKQIDSLISRILE